MKTKREQLVNALISNGAVEVESRTRKYLTFQFPNGRLLYFVGKSGALRCGKCASQSFSVSEVAKAKLIESGMLKCV